MVSKHHFSRNFINLNDLYHFHPEFKLLHTPYNYQFDKNKPVTHIADNNISKIKIIYPSSQLPFSDLYEYDINGSLSKKIIMYDEEKSGDIFKTIEVFDKIGNPIEIREERNGKTKRFLKYTYNYNDNCDITYISSIEEFYLDKFSTFNHELYYYYLEVENLKLVIKFDPKTFYNTRIDLFECDNVFSRKISKFINYSLLGVPQTIEYSNEKIRTDYIKNLIREPKSLLFKFQGEKMNHLLQMKEFGYDEFENINQIRKYKCEQEILGLGNVPNKNPELDETRKLGYNRKFGNYKINKIDKTYHSGHIKGSILEYDYDEFGNVIFYRFFKKSDKSTHENSYVLKYDNDLLVESIDKRKFYIKFEYSFR